MARQRQARVLVGATQPFPEATLVEMARGRRRESGRAAAVAPYRPLRPVGRWLVAGAVAGAADRNLPHQ